MPRSPETILEPGVRTTGYRPGFERFGSLIRQLAETPHQGCLLLTSREEPPELGPLRGEQGPVRVLHLGGLGVDDGRALLSGQGLDGDDAAWQELVGRCGGNGLALKVVGETARELFGGSIADYLEYATTMSVVMVGGVRELLGAQIQRLSDLEVDLLRRMAVERGPVGLADLAAELGPRIGRGATLEAVEGLRRRSLLERSERGMLFGLHSVVLEFVTEQLIEDFSQELVIGQPDRLLRQPPLKATAKDYLRRSQERLIAGPILEQLVATRGSARAAEQWLVRLLDNERQRPVEDHGYGPGNLVNLLRLLRGHLRGIDLSGLAIRQAYLPDVEAQGASLARSHLTETVLGEAFNYPTTLALSADGAYLVAGTASGEVCRWRVADRTLLVTVPGHTAAIWGLAQSRDGQLVASASLDGIVRLWDAESGRELAALRGHDGGVWGVCLRGDAKLVASGGYDVTVNLWDANDGQLLRTLQGHAAGVNGVALSGDGQLVVSGSWDHTVKLWDTGTGETLATLAGHTGGVWGVAVSEDGTLVVSGGYDEAAMLWDARSGQLLVTMLGHAGGVRGVSISADRRTVASSGVDETIRVWNAENRRLLHMLAGDVGGALDVALSRDGRLVASGSEDGIGRVWDVERGELRATLLGHSGQIYGVAFADDGQVATASIDGAIRFWDTVSGTCLSTLRADRPYERMNITGLTGVTEAQRGALLALGAVERGSRLSALRSR